MMRRSLAVSLSILMAATAASCRRGEASREGADARAAGRALPVAVEPATRRDLARAVTVAGPVEPVRSIGVNSQASGTVLAVRVQEGDRVTAGQLLAQLDGREVEAQLARARAALQSATSAFERDSQLAASTIITPAEYERTRTAYDIARSDALLWETRRSFTRITAPAAAVVTAKHVEAGSAVSPNQRLFDLADVSLLVVRVQLSEVDVVHIVPGAPVTVKFDAFPEARVSARVRRVFPSADPQSRLVPVEVALGARPEGVEVRPGFLARAEFALETRTAVLAVLASAVGVTSSGPFVFVVDTDTLVQRPVQLGVTVAGRVEVTDGLREGEAVVVSGHTNLRAGARVRVSSDAGSGVERP